MRGYRIYTVDLKAVQDEVINISTNLRTRWNMNMKNLRTSSIIVANKAHNDRLNKDHNSSTILDQALKWVRWTAKSLAVLLNGVTTFLPR